MDLSGWGPHSTREKRTERQTDTLLVLVFPWDLLTSKKYKITSASSWDDFWWGVFLNRKKNSESRVENNCCSTATCGKSQDFYSVFVHNPNIFSVENYVYYKTSTQLISLQNSWWICNSRQQINSLMKHFTATLKMTGNNIGNRALDNIEYYVTWLQVCYDASTW